MFKPPSFGHCQSKAATTYHGDWHSCILTAIKCKMLIGTVYGYGVRITVCLISLCSSPIVGRWLGDVDCFYFYLPSLLVCCLWCLPFAALPAHGEAVATAELILGKHVS